MKIKVLSLVIVSMIIIITAVLYWPFSSPKAIYPVGSCFKDRDMKIKFKVLNVSRDSYTIEVINSGHYSMSPDYFKGNQLLYSRSDIESQSSKYHPAICIEVEDQNPSE